MMIRNQKLKGFTLIEVTLAIVIGIVMIAGATLIYNQARTSSGNSRAQTKVTALQQLVEEYAAQNQGSYMTNLNDVNVLLNRKRPDDWSKSPWGGQIGSHYLANSNNPNGMGVWTRTDVAVIDNQGGASMSAGSVAFGNALVSNLNPSTNTQPVYSGGLLYSQDTANSSVYSWKDVLTNTTISWKGYVVSICDGVGRFPNFVAGGKTN
jgi:type II secretory pathway pseudopilin PulG